MISITMSAEQFECGMNQIMADGVLVNPDIDNKFIGHIHTKQIDADYEYREEGSSLVFLNEKKHGLYGFVSDDTIGTHLADLFKDLKCPEASASEEQVLQPEPESLPEATPENTTTVDTSQFVKPKQSASSEEVK